MNTRSKMASCSNRETSAANAAVPLATPPSQPGPVTTNAAKKPRLLDFSSVPNVAASMNSNSSNHVLQTYFDQPRVGTQSILRQHSKASHTPCDQDHAQIQSSYHLLESTYTSGLGQMCIEFEFNSVCKIDV